MDSKYVVLKLKILSEVKYFNELSLIEIKTKIIIVYFTH
jgi:hypothetical protein